VTEKEAKKNILEQNRRRGKLPVTFDPVSAGETNRRARLQTPPSGVSTNQ